MPQGNCTCGRPLHTNTKCKPCYMRDWHAAHPNQRKPAHIEQAETLAWRRAINPLLVFLEAFGCTREDYARYVLWLRRQHQKSIRS